jgi:hypothetical protein
MTGRLERRLILVSAVGLVCVVASASASRAAGPPCVTTDFKTEMVRLACEKGGQDEAQKQMKAFVAKYAPKKKTKGAPIFTCNACHTTLAPKFERKPDAVEFYKALGGR